jgi:hypothetical protein
MIRVVMGYTHDICARDFRSAYCGFWISCEKRIDQNDFPIADYLKCGLAQPPERAHRITSKLSSCLKFKIFEVNVKVLGLDLAGIDTNPSGFALLSNRRFRTGLIYSDDEIIELCAKNRPEVVAIDAPLSLPKSGSLRKADALLIGRGYRVLPPTLGGMRALTERGIRLADRLRTKAFGVIEIHPRTSGKILFGTQERRDWLFELKQQGWSIDARISEHEVDAAIAALTGALKLWGKTEEVGTPTEGIIIIPRGRLGSHESA